MKLEKRKNILPAALIGIAISIVAFLLRWRGIEHITADVEACLIPWSAAMKPGYGFSVLSHFEGDYNLPYVTVLWLLNYLPGSTVVKVKLFSILFDYLGACGVGLIAAHFTKKPHQTQIFLASYALTLLYPVTILNSAYWGQCDFIYVTFVLYMLLCLLKGREGLAMVFLGCAFSFKLQAVLILPFLLIWFWKVKKASFLNLLIVPVVMEILCIPAILGGSPLWIPFSVYFRQLGRYPYMYVYYPNLWALFRDAPYYIFKNVAIFSILAALIVFAVIVIRQTAEISQKRWMEIALWSVFCMMCFLPCMHERYGFLLEILAILCAVLMPHLFWLPLVLGGGATVAYLQVTFGKHYFSDQWIAAAYLLAFGFYTFDLVRRWMQSSGGQSLSEQPLIGQSAEGQPRSLQGGTVPIFTWECRIIDAVNRRLYLIAAVLLTVLAVLIRKPMIEVMSPDYLSNLILTDGNTHTGFYMAILWAIGHSVDKPLLFLVKLFCIGCDLLAAAACAYWVYRRTAGAKGNMSCTLPGMHAKALQTALLCYGAYLFMPAVLLNSSLWGHLDSLCIFLLVLTLLLLERDRIGLAAVPAALACAVQMQYAPYVVLLLIWWRLYGGQRAADDRVQNAVGGGVVRPRRIRFAGACGIGILVLSLASCTGLVTGMGLRACFARLLPWVSLQTWYLYPLLIALLLAALLSDIRLLCPLTVLQVLMIVDWGQFISGTVLEPFRLCKPGYLLGLLLTVVLLYRHRSKKYRN